MRIAGHTIGTPEHTVREAIDLFARLGMEGIEAICHDEYRLPPTEIGMKAGADLVRRILRELD